jgi:hypothetical protein
MLCGIRRQFVQGHAQRDSKISGQVYVWPLQFEALRLALSEKSKFVQQHLAQRDRLPVILRQQLLGLTKGRDPV